VKEKPTRLEKLLPNRPKVKDAIIGDEQNSDDQRLELLRLNVKKPYFKNDKKMKDGICIGARIFERELKQSALREGY
jgi:hypothetical protein